jgi:branched-subunit amino acid aminotransferase/4-amino-4-deoxychorismate lyase
MTELRNRAFLYGESVFATMRVTEDRILFQDLHLRRILKGANYVFGPFAGVDWERKLQERLLESIKLPLKNAAADSVIRLTLFADSQLNWRQMGSFEHHLLGLDVACWGIEKDRDQFRPIELFTCQGRLRPQWWPAWLKSGNYLETILARKQRLKESEQDLLMLDLQGQVLEASAANIFIIKDGVLKTPPVGPNVLEGILREVLLKYQKHFFREVHEINLTLKELQAADMVFLGNSVTGIIPVKSIDNVLLPLGESQLKWLNELNQEVMK